ncbi:MAG: hypothetical protein OEV59_01405 [Deltaproteobacteria bacterium]|nr:hypothetical protein [Deltaproteobacteria bacterium]
MLGNITIGAFISWFLRGVMVALLPYQLYLGQYPFAALTLLAIVLSAAPALIERSYQVHLPFELDMLITVAIFAHTFFGEWLSFYDRLPGWDKALHFYSTGVVALFGFLMVYTLHYTRKIRLSILLVGFFSVVFSVFIGVLWEFMEFWMDVLFGTHMQNGLSDTMWDLMFDVVGGTLVAVLGMVYVRYTNPETRRRLARPLAHVLKWVSRQGQREDD